MKLYRMSSAALVCVFLLGACQQGDQVEEGEDEEETPAIPVETTTPIRGDIDATYTGTAPIEAFSEATVIAKVEGDVRQILVEEGDTVVKNQVLARLDGDRLRLEMNESQARLRKMQRDFERNQELTETGLISEGDFEKIKFDLEALQAAYNLANLELDYTQIRAPIDGVVSERFIKIGNTIKAGDPIFHVTSLSPLVAYLHVPEREYHQIAAGQPAGIRIDALGGDPILAYVTRVSPIVDPATGTFKITIEIGNEQKRIKPGMFGRMAITYDRHENALQIPRSAIIESATATSVLVEEEGIAIRKAVQTGYSFNGMIEITNGLDDGENVITVGQVGLKSDSRVNVINRPVDDDPVPDDSSGTAVMTEGSTASIEDAD